MHMIHILYFSLYLRFAKLDSDQMGGDERAGMFEYSLLVAVEYSIVKKPVPLLNNTDKMFSFFTGRKRRESSKGY